MDQLPLSRAYSQRIHKQRLIRAVANLFPKDSPISPFPPARAGVMHTCTSLSLSAARGAHDEPNRCILQNRHPQHSPIWQGWYIRPFPHRNGSGLYHPYSPAASFEVAYICRRSLAAQRATLHNSRRFSPAPSQKEAGSGKMWKRAKNLPLLLTGLKNDPIPSSLWSRPRKVCQGPDRPGVHGIGRGNPGLWTTASAGGTATLEYPWTNGETS